MSGELLIALALLVPLAGAALIRLTGSVPNQREAVTLTTAIALFVVVLCILALVANGVQPELVLAELLPGLRIAFKVEPLGALFATVASGLWILTSVYSIGYMRSAGEGHQTRFYVCFAIALFSAVGLAFSANLLTLFLLYEVLTLSTYPLVAHHGDEEARRGGRTYLGLLLFTSIALLLLGIVLVWSEAGTLEFTPGGVLAGRVDPAVGSLLLLLFAFGVGKAALMPFHRWLPAAMVAPTPVSALLHAVAVVKAGVFTILKVAIYIFGVDYIAGLWASELVLYVAAFTILAASIVAMRQDNLKRRLAYSTVSQLSYVILGAFVGNAVGAVAGGVHLAMHAFGKITLFFCAGAIYVAAHKTKVSELDGLGRTMPFTLAAFALGALSVVGLPPLGGSWSKFLLALGAAESKHWLLIGVLMLSSLLNVFYLLGPVARAFFRKPADDTHGAEPGHAHGNAHGHGPAGAIAEAPLFCVVPLCLTALGSLALFFAAGSVYDLLATIRMVAP